MQNARPFGTINLMKYAFVTGATGVLGTAFCRLLAKEGYGLFITGRSPQKLQALKTSIIQAYPGADCNFYPAYLSCDGDVLSLFSAAESYRFSLVVNVAGADIQKPFCEYDLPKLTFQTRACFEGAVKVCLFALTHRAGKLNIINISSLCGEQPMPYFALYSACKGALTDFSVALSRETKSLGVSVTAVVAGSIYTRLDVKEYINSLGFWARKSAKTPEYVAAKSLKASKKGKVKYIPGGLNKFIYALSRIVPGGLKTRWLASSRKKVRKDAF